MKHRFYCVLGSSVSLCVVVESGLFRSGFDPKDLEVTVRIVLVNW